MHGLLQLVKQTEYNNISSSVIHKVNTKDNCNRITLYYKRILNIKYLNSKLKIIIRFILVFTQRNIFHFVGLKMFRYKCFIFSFPIYSLS